MVYEAMRYIEKKKKVNIWLKKCLIQPLTILFQAINEIEF